MNNFAQPRQPAHLETAGSSVPPGPQARRPSLIVGRASRRNWFRQPQSDLQNLSNTNSLTPTSRGISVPVPSDLELLRAWRHHHRAAKGANGHHEGGINHGDGNAGHLFTGEKFAVRDFSAIFNLAATASPRGHSWNVTHTPLGSIAPNSFVPQGLVCKAPLGCTLPPRFWYSAYKASMP